MRWLLLDEITEIRKGVHAVARSHIPDVPLSPEPLFLEMMAQTAGLVLGAENDYRTDLVIAKIEKALFQTGWASGDALEVRCCTDQIREEGAWFEGNITGPSGPVVSARLLLMKMPSPIPEQGRSVTFHPAFMEHFNVRAHVSTAGKPESV